MVFTEPLEIALIGLGVASLSSLSPLVALIITWRQKHKDRIEDYARQDQVAAQAAEAARLLIAANDRVAAQNKETQNSLKEIHTLVNSNLTSEMRNRFLAVSGQVALTKEIIRLNRINKIDPSEETLISLRGLEDVVKGLSLALQDRMQQNNEPVLKPSKD